MNKSLADNFAAGFKAFGRVEQFDSKRFGKRYRQVANPMKPKTTPYREWQRMGCTLRTGEQNGPRAKLKLDEGEVLGITAQQSGSVILLSFKEQGYGVSYSWPYRRGKEDANKVKKFIRDGAP